MLAGLDVGRFEWSPLAPPLRAIGLLGYIVSVCILYWAVRVNPFYSSVVRVQSDRGQVAIDAGPYRFVRHPGYAATLLGMATGGLALGSGLALVPIALVMGVFVRRTLVEDRLLRRELAGYAEYALRVRHRLIAGVF